MTSLVIPGLGTAQVSRVEYTSNSVLSLYVEQLTHLKEVFDKRPGADGGTVDDMDVAKLRAAVESLTNLLFNGVTEGTPPNSYTFFLPKDLAIKLGTILQSLKTVGIYGTEVPADVFSAIAGWQSLAGIGLENAMNDALLIQNGFYTRTLQSMIETVYIKQGNDIIFGQLGDLESALRNTQDILETLTIIQNLSNQIRAPAPGEFPMTTGHPDSPPLYANDYMQSASAFFSQQIPIPDPRSTAAVELLAARSALIIKLDRLESDSKHSRTSANTLAFFLDIVIRDITDHFASTDPTSRSAMSTAIYQWILDGQNLPVGSTQAVVTGKVQDHLAQAIKASESLNDSQKDKVQRYMYIFQQFYQSASAVLQKVTQIVEKIAQGIGR